MNGECARCGQTGGETVCPACRAQDREKQGEPQQLFKPAPPTTPGQLSL